METKEPNSKKVKETAIAAEVILPEGVTEAQVKAWKERYGEGKVKASTLFDADGVELLSVVTRAPNRKELGEWEKWVDKNPDRAKDLLVKSCLLSHKEEVLEDQQLFLSAYDAISAMLPIGRSVSKNL